LGFARIAGAFGNLGQYSEITGHRASPIWVMPPRTMPHAAMPQLNSKTLQSTIKTPVRSWPKKEEIRPKLSMTIAQTTLLTASDLF
jgi:hypothetical protein